ncbi:MAG: putative DNA-binding domain-containing protein [Gammaproteobacteria bacterium]|nr:putative DNA-binding domain-containing protein [Gammaproteobacteria bacterium]
MADKRAFQDQQYAFAAHLRDPEHVAAPAGIEDRRMAIYRKLFFNNLNNLLATMFPVLRKIHSDARWRRMIRLFMQQHKAETPYFLQLPEEFLLFLQNEFKPDEHDYAFLTELAHYEYAELALAVSTEENDLADVDPDGDLLSNAPVKSKLVWAYAYHYPVHRISPDYLPDSPAEQPVYLAVYRRSDDKVRFLELSAVTAALLDAIDNNDDNRSGEELLRELAETIHYPDVEALTGHGATALEEMRQLEIILGVRCAT